MRVALYARMDWITGRRVIVLVLWRWFVYLNPPRIRTIGKVYPCA